MMSWPARAARYVEQQGKESWPARAARCVEQQDNDKLARCQQISRRKSGQNEPSIACELTKSVQTRGTSSISTNGRPGWPRSAFFAVVVGTISGCSPALG